MIPKRNTLLDITKANQILLSNSSHCNLLLKELIAAQTRNSNQEVKNPLNFQQMRIVARSQKNQSTVVAEKIQLQNPQYTYATNAEQVTQQKNVVLPSEKQNHQMFQQLNNSWFPQNHNQFPNKTALQFSSLPTQSYTPKQTNEQPVARLCSQPTILPNNLQNY